MALEGKVAVIVGGSRGIGRDVAVALADAGADVVVAARSEAVTDPRLPGTIYTVAEEIQARGRKALPLRVDVTKDEELEALYARTLDEFGRVDIVFNNAAAIVRAPLRGIQPRHIDLLYRVDLRAMIMSCRYAADALSKTGGGHIVNVSSRAALFPGVGPYSEEQQRRVKDGSPMYGVMKAALEFFSQSFAAEVQDQGIAVNVVSPEGLILTPGAMFARQDKNNPNLDFEEAVAMGAATVWVCQQDPRQYTGNVIFAEPFCREHGLL